MTAAILPPEAKYPHVISPFGGKIVLTQTVTLGLTLTLILTQTQHPTQTLTII